MPKLVDSRTSDGRSAGTTGRSFTTESSPFFCTRAGDDPRAIEREIGGVEEVHLADLGVDWVDGERLPGAAPVGQRHGELELDAVGLANLREKLGERLVGGRDSRGHGHPLGFVAREAILAHAGFRFTPVPHQPGPALRCESGCLR